MAWQSSIGEMTMLKIIRVMNPNILKMIGIAGVSVGVLALQVSPAAAFSHDKLQQRLHELTKPAAPPTPPKQVAPIQVAPKQAVPMPRAAKPAPAAQPTRPAKKQPKRSIRQIAGDVYQFKNNFHNSVFMMTTYGTIVVDPINSDAASWLKAELQRRFNQSVKYVIYSHDHADHISGGEVFSDTATFVSHAQTKRDIIEERRPTPIPEITFTDKLTLELGGKTVELTYVGRNHSDNSIVMNFPSEGVLHAVDFIPVKSIAFRDLPDAYLDDWMQSLKNVEAMDFRILSPGHGRLGNKQDVRAFRGYMEALRAQVTKMARTGKSVDDVVATVTIDKYKSWGGYKRHIKANVRAMYKLVQLNRRGNP
jgi:glyoxylase-like metal-dependent hydrolase (beta-lactamase superfamily II)